MHVKGRQLLWVTTRMSPLASTGLPAAWTDPSCVLLHLTGAPIAAAEG